MAILKPSHFSNSGRDNRKSEDGNVYYFPSSLNIFILLFGLVPNPTQYIERQQQKTSNYNNKTILFNVKQTYVCLKIGGDLTRGQ